MKTFELLSTFVRRSLYRIDVVHDVSGAHIPSLQAELLDGPPSWTTAVVQGQVVVAGPVGSEAEGFEIALTIADPAVELYLDTSDDALVVPLVDAFAEHRILPAPQVIEVILIDDESEPVEGRSITIRAQTGTETIATTEEPPGHYRTGEQAFTSSFNRFRIRDGTDEIAEAGLLSWQGTTSVTVVDTA